MPRASTWDLKGKSIRLRLAAVGRAQFRKLLPNGWIKSQVLDQDERGLWILAGKKQTGESKMAIPAMLIKWDYIATIAFDYQYVPIEKKEIR